MLIKIERLLGGVKMAECTHEARRAGLHGLYRDGTPYLPDTESVLDSLPYALRKAFSRNPAWWIRDESYWKATCNLTSLRGKDLGVLVATLIY